MSVLNPDSGFHICEIKSTDRSGWDYTMSVDAVFEVVREEGDPLHPFANTPINLKGTMFDSAGKPVDTNLVPLGCTLLRRPTFPQSAEIEK